MQDIIVAHENICIAAKIRIFRPDYTKWLDTRLQREAYTRVCVHTCTERIRWNFARFPDAVNGVFTCVHVCRKSEPIDPPRCAGTRERERLMKNSSFMPGNSSPRFDIGIMHS